MKPPKSLSDWNLVARYPYRNARGALIMEHRKFEWYDPITGARHKTLRYWDVGLQVGQKPPGADGLLFRLPEVLAEAERGEVIWWPEGEGDATSLVATGAAATTHHQGAGHVHPRQAASLLSARRIHLLVDKDWPDASVGAFDAALRYDTLLDVGVPASRIRVFRAPGPWHGSGAIKDVSDAIAAGYDLADVVPVSLDRLAQVARRYTPSAGRRRGYCG